MQGYFLFCQRALRYVKSFRYSPFFIQLLFFLSQPTSYFQILYPLFRRKREFLNHLNGYKPRRLRTRVGKLELLVPQDREGEFKTELFRRYQKSEKALVLSLIEMYINSHSTVDGKYLPFHKKSPLMNKGFSSFHPSKIA